MIETIRTPFLTVEVNTCGAELNSVKPADGIERLWQGDPALWNRKGPMLFPVIGRLKDGQYLWEGEAYSISSHGFARDLPFEVTGKGEDFITLTLTDTPDTYKVYPFAFELEVTYKLEGSTIVKTHRITNRSGGEMAYEVGGHEGWNTTLFPGETMADYHLHFEGLEEIRPFMMQEETLFMQKDTISIPLVGGDFPLPPDTRGLDTLVLEGVTKVSLVGKNGPVVTVDCPEYPYLAFWTCKNAPEQTHYICIEPWTTLPEADYVGPNLKDKAGIRVLKPGESETFAYTMTIH